MSNQAAPASKRARHDWSLADKIWLLDYRDRNKQLKLSSAKLGEALAEHLNSDRSADKVRISPPKKSTVNDWIKATNRLRELHSNASSQSLQRNRAPNHPRLEEALTMWFRRQEARGLTVTNDLLRGQARMFAIDFDVPDTFEFSDGWLQGFKLRKGIRRVVLHGEADAADKRGVQLTRDNMKLIVDGYSLDDIYNQDETGVFWRQLPQRTLATGKRAGRKQDKQRVTVSLTCNASGTDKRELFVIGKAKRPRSFPRQFNPQRDWGMRYRNNAKAWMLSEEFSSWIHDWNIQLRGCVHIPLFTISRVSHSFEQLARIAGYNARSC